MPPSVLLPLVFTHPVEKQDKRSLDTSGEVRLQNPEVLSQKLKPMSERPGMVDHFTTANTNFTTVNTKTCIAEKVFKKLIFGFIVALI